MKRTKAEAKADYRLDTEPSDRLMELLEQAGKIRQADLDTVSPPAGLVSEPVTPQELLDQVQGVIFTQAVGEMLEQARKQARLTMQQVADAIGVSRGRVNQLEHPDANLELGTLVKVASALGASLEVRLIPKDPQQKSFVAKLK